MNLLRANALIFCGLLLPSLAAALSSDRDEPIHIRADRVEVNERTGVSVYLGDVHVSQGSLVVTADRLYVYRKEGELDRIEADGQPATFQQRPDGAEHDVRGQARHVEYHAARNKAYLIGNAHVWRGDDEFAGERIIYDTFDSVVQASGGEGERVRAVIRPKSERNDQ